MCTNVMYFTVLLVDCEPRRGFHVTYLSIKRKSKVIIRVRGE